MVAEKHSHCGRTPAHIWQCHPHETAEAAAAAAILILQLFRHWIQQLGFSAFQRSNIC